MMYVAREQKIVFAVATVHCLCVVGFFCDGELST